MRPEHPAKGSAIVFSFERPAQRAGQVPRHSCVSRRGRPTRIDHAASHEKPTNHIAAAFTEKTQVRWDLSRHSAEPCPREDRRRSPTGRPSAIVPKQPCRRHSPQEPRKKTTPAEHPAKGSAIVFSFERPARRAGQVPRYQRVSRRGHPTQIAQDSPAAQLFNFRVNLLHADQAPDGTPGWYVGGRAWGPTPAP